MEMKNGFVTISNLTKIQSNKKCYRYCKLNKDNTPQMIMKFLELAPVLVNCDYTSYK